RTLTCRGSCAGLGSRWLVWLYALVLPHIALFGWLDPDWLLAGPAGLEWLRPQALFGQPFNDPLTHGVFWSLLADILVMALVSSNTSQSLIEQLGRASCRERG